VVVQLDGISFYSSDCYLSLSGLVLLNERIAGWIVDRIPPMVLINAWSDGRDIPIGTLTDGSSGRWVRVNVWKQHALIGWTFFRGGDCSS